ncbi:bifunctional DNA primase/polymerase [candidate division KSB1 bacterium]|nr:bifunctional DNA primase/polymerase [candidate division KSB1 bacterium]
MPRGVLEFVAGYRALGFKPTPLKGKKALLNSWQRTDLPEDQDSLHFRPGVNVGIRSGDPSGGLVDVDLDSSLAVAIARFFLPHTPFVFGHASKQCSHYFYIVNPTPKTKKFVAPDGTTLVELRGTGGQTMVPPSRHPCGEDVVFSTEGGALPGCPARVTQDVLLWAVKQIAAATLLAMHWPIKGARQDAALALAGGLLRAGWTPDHSCRLIEAVATAAGDDEVQLRLGTVGSTAAKLGSGVDLRGWPTLAELVGRREVEKVCDWLGVRRSAIHIAAAEDAKVVQDIFHCSDIGNPQRLANTQAETLKFVSSGKQGGLWMMWDGIRWINDQPGAERSAKDVALRIYAETANAVSQAEREQVSKWAMRSESAERIMAMLKLARSEISLQAKPEDFDSDPMLLNVQNGILDLRTAQLSPHVPTALMTKVAGVPYDPNAECPTWQKFLHEIMDENEELIAFLRTCAGYSLTGLTSEHKFFFCHGAGANGKTTFLETNNEMLGGYGQQAEFSTFLRSQHGRDGARSDIANLKGARLIVAGEVPPGQQFDESLLKQLTGGDRVRARHLYQDEFEFSPQFKIWLAANHKPRLRPDPGIMRRIVLIPFGVMIPPDRQDKQLRDKLRAELPGILSWAVQGCLVWQRDGLIIPGEVHAAINEYRAENDPIACFIAECCERDVSASTSATGLYNRYKVWWLANHDARGHDVNVPSQRWFGERLGDMGLNRRRLTDGTYWDGIWIAEDLPHDSGPTSF